MSRHGNAVLRRLRKLGLSYPGAHIKSPWPNHEDLAVKDKTFAYLPAKAKPFSISCKLPESCEVALALPFCMPTGYGLGKWGWVTATIEGDDIPEALFADRIEESYRAQAPKKLVRELDQES